MIQKWIESIFIKRTALALTAAAIAQWTAHQIPIIDHLSIWGVHLTMTIDQKVFSDHLILVFMGLSQGLHEYVASKYPEIGKYL